MTCKPVDIFLDIRHVVVGSNVGQIGPKWEKSGSFLDQISVHFDAPHQNVLKSDLKKSRIRPIVIKLTNLERNQKSLVCVLT